MKIIISLVFIAFLFVAGIRYVERHSIYFPMREMGATPQEAGLAYEDVYFTTPDGKKLNGWFIPAANEKEAFTFLFAHGNAGNISHRFEKISILHDLGMNVFIFDYRGYGKSEGSPFEAGLYKDAEGAYGYLVNTKKIPEDKIILYGESIGGCIMVDLATKATPCALITEDALSSVRDMAKTSYPFLPAFLFSTRFDAADKIKEVKCPKLIIHSVDDEIVPFRLGEKLFNAAKPPKEFLKIRGGHNTAFLDSEKEYKEGIRSFLEKL